MTEDVVPLKCSSSALETLSSDLTSFGPAVGCPDWLLTGAWLCASDAEYFATAFADVLPDGFVARPLCIESPDGITAQIEADIPDIQDRLVARGSKLQLQSSVPSFAPPETLERWPAAPYSMAVLLRVAKTATVTHRIACALLFRSEAGQTLLVGTDTSTLAMVFSEDPALIERYQSACETLSLGEYQARIGA